MQPNLSRHSGLFVSRLRISARIVCGDSPSRASRARRRTVCKSRRKYEWMVSSSRNIPSRGGAAVSSDVDAVAKVSSHRSAVSSRIIYMHVHNCMREASTVARAGWIIHSRLDSSTSQLSDSARRRSTADFGHDLQQGKDRGSPYSPSPEHASKSAMSPYHMGGAWPVTWNEPQRLSTALCRHSSRRSHGGLASVCESLDY